MKWVSRESREVIIGFIDGFDTNLKVRGLQKVKASVMRDFDFYSKES